MTIGSLLLLALVAGVVASGLDCLIEGYPAWSWRRFAGLTVALTLIAYVALHGPFQLGS